MVDFILTQNIITHYRDWLPPLLLHHGLILMLRENGGVIGDPSTFDDSICYTEYDLAKMRNEEELLMIICLPKSGKEWLCGPTCKSYNKLVAKKKQARGYSCLSQRRITKDAAEAIACWNKWPKIACKEICDRPLSRKFASDMPVSRYLAQQIHQEN